MMQTWADYLDGLKAGGKGANSQGARLAPSKTPSDSAGVCGASA